MRRILYRVVLVALVLTLFFFWCIPYSQRNDSITWIGIVFTGVGTVILSLLSYRRLRTWRGLGVLLSLHLAAQLWLQWQWDLWDSSLVLVRNLNVVAGLIAWMTLVAIIVSILLLLIYRDASVIALALAWLGWPLLLLATMVHYRTMENLDAAPMREQIVLVVALGLLTFLLIGGGIALGAHFIWSVITEIVGQKTRSEV